MHRAAIYARYSSERQRATSIEDQIRLRRELAPRFDCVIPDGQVYTDHEITGAADQRPAYHALLDAARTRQFEVILAESQDRLWRDHTVNSCRSIPPEW